MRVHHVLVISSPTAFLDVNKTPSITRALYCMQSYESTGPVSIAVDRENVDILHNTFKTLTAHYSVVVCSTQIPKSLAQELAPLLSDADTVLLHDASRPLTSKKEFDDVLAALNDETDAVRPAIAFTETLKVLTTDSVIRRTLDRSTVIRISTPELIRVSAIDFEGTDCGWFLPLKEGTRTAHVEGSVNGLRINNAEVRDLMELQSPSS